MQKEASTMVERYGASEYSGDVEGTEWEYETVREEDEYVGSRVCLQVYFRGVAQLPSRPYFSSEGDAAGFALGYIYARAGWETENPFYL